MMTSLTADLLRKMDAYWRASNYLSVGQIYLLDNPLHREPLKREHVKTRRVGVIGGSWGVNSRRGTRITRIKAGMKRIRNQESGDRR